MFPLCQFDEHFIFIKQQLFEMEGVLLPAVCQLVRHIGGENYISEIFKLLFLFHFNFPTLSQKRKGVEGLIDIENPNRAAQKTKKVTELELEEPKQLSRRER